MEGTAATNLRNIFAFFWDVAREKEVQSMKQGILGAFPVGFTTSVAVFQHLLAIYHTPGQVCHCPCHWEQQLKVICKQSISLWLLRAGEARC